MVAALQSTISSTSKILQVGNAFGDHIDQTSGIARSCFEQHLAANSAVGCVLAAFEKISGWSPAVEVFASPNCRQCDAPPSKPSLWGAATVMEVRAGSRAWLLVLRSAAAPTLDPLPSESPATALRQGVATDGQLADMLRGVSECFGRHAVDASSVARLDATLPAAGACVQSRCQGRWGWKPRVSQLGSHRCGRCKGLGAASTVIVVTTASGQWMIVMDLR